MARAAFLACALTAGATPAAALSIVLDADEGLTANPEALAAFERAASQWEAVIADPITVHIEANLGSYSSTTIGFTGLVFVTDSHDAIRQLMIDDASWEPDDEIVRHLPEASAFSIELPEGYGLDGDIMLTKANLKALGVENLDAVFGVKDASITFNANYAFDYDRSDGVASTRRDFETVAAHEIGHALGFFSRLDFIDYAVRSGAITDDPLFPFDLFRFDAAGVPTDLAGFESLPRSLIPGNAEVFSDLGVPIALSTGFWNGDGNQGSHWKDDRLTGETHGLMDPTLDAGAYRTIGSNDLRVLDLIGYDIPEPTAPTLLALALLAGALHGDRARRRLP